MAPPAKAVLAVKVLFDTVSVFPAIAPPKAPAVLPEKALPVTTIMPLPAIAPPGQPPTGAFRFAAVMASRSVHPGPPVPAELLLTAMVFARATGLVAPPSAAAISKAASAVAPAPRRAHPRAARWSLEAWE